MTEWVGSGKVDCGKWIGSGRIAWFWQNGLARGKAIGSGRMDWLGQGGLALAEWIGSNKIILPDQSRGHCFFDWPRPLLFDWPQATHTKLLDFARHFLTNPDFFVVCGLCRVVACGCLCWSTNHDMSRNRERHDFYFKWSDICVCFNQNLCTALRHSLRHKCVLELDGATVCFIQSEACRRLLCDWIRAGRPHFTC